MSLLVYSYESLYASSAKMFTGCCHGTLLTTAVRGVRPMTPAVVVAFAVFMIDPPQALAKDDTSGDMM